MLKIATPPTFSLELGSVLKVQTSSLQVQNGSSHLQNARLQVQNGSLNLQNYHLQLQTIVCNLQNPILYITSAI